MENERARGVKIFFFSFCLVVAGLLPVRIWRVKSRRAAAEKTEGSFSCFKLIKGWTNLAEGIVTSKICCVKFLWATIICSPSLPAGRQGSQIFQPRTQLFFLLEKHVSVFTKTQKDWSSPVFSYARFCDLTENRTPISGLRTRCPNR